MRVRSSSREQWLKQQSLVFVRGFGVDCVAKDLREQFISSGNR